MARVSRKRNNTSLEKLSKALSQKRGVDVGIFASAKYTDGTPVAGVAVVHEFGSPKQNIPARPFLRPTIEEKQPEWADIFKLGIQSSLKGYTPIENVLDALGQKASGQVRTTVSSLTSPPLKEATSERKGFDKPLVEHGIMSNAISYRVKK